MSDTPKTLGEEWLEQIGREIRDRLAKAYYDGVSAGMARAVVDGQTAYDAVREEGRRAGEAEREQVAAEQWEAGHKQGLAEGRREQEAEVRALNAEVATLRYRHEQAVAARDEALQRGRQEGLQQAAAVVERYDLAATPQIVNKIRALSPERLFSAEEVREALEAGRLGKGLLEWILRRLTGKGGEGKRDTRPMCDCTGSPHVWDDGCPVDGGEGVR